MKVNITASCRDWRGNYWVLAHRDYVCTCRRIYVTPKAAKTMTKKKKYQDFRSYRWYGVDDLRAFGHRSRTMQMGYDAQDWDGKPVIGIINTWSDINPCHIHFKERIEHVKRGVLQAGGFPIELPAISLSEPIVKPTTMMYRNFLAMETEELLRSHPIDACVLMGGCDKTTPGLLMGQSQWICRRFSFRRSDAERELEREEPR